MPGFRKSRRPPYPPSQGGISMVIQREGNQTVSMLYPKGGKSVSQHALSKGREIRQSACFIQREGNQTVSMLYPKGGKSDSQHGLHPKGGRPERMRNYSSLWIKGGDLQVGEFEKLELPSLQKNKRRRI